MKKLITCCAALAAAALYADTAVWTKTDAAEGDFATVGNWENDAAPQNGDNVSFPSAPGAGIDAISVRLPQYRINNPVYLGEIGGLAAYDLMLYAQSSVSLTDASDFSGTFRVGHYPNGFDSYPAEVILRATAEDVPTVNNYDSRYNSSVVVADAGTEGRILNVVQTAPGAIHKKGEGTLSAAFASGADQKVYVEAGQLTVRATEQPIDLSQALVSGSAALGVKAGETVQIGTVVANGGDVTVRGSGDLFVGSLVKREIQGSGDQAYAVDSAGKVNLSFGEGGFGVLASNSVNNALITTEPYIHLDASASGVFTMDGTDPTLVAEWRDPDSGLAATGMPGLKDGGRLPKLVPNGLNGMPVVDFGTPTDKYHSGDGTAGYVAFTETPTVHAAFLVYRRKSLECASAFLGGDQEWECSFRGYPDVPAALICYDGEGNPRPTHYLGDARIDGAAIDISKYRFTDTDFHVVSLTIGEGFYPNTSYIGGTATDWSQYGGIELAEAIIYDKYLAPGERVEIEKRLMAKWLPEKAAQKPAVGTLSFTGDMRVTANQDLTVDTLSGDGVLVKKGPGSLSIASQMGIGGVDVQEGDVSFTVSGSSGSEPAVMQSAWFRMDPSVAATLTTNEEGRVIHIADSNGGTVVSATNSLVHQKGDYINHVPGPTIVAAPNTGLNLLDFGEYQGQPWETGYMVNACGMSLLVNGEQTSDDKFWPDAQRTCFVRTAVVVVEKLNESGKQAFLGARAWSKFGSTNGKIIDTDPDDAHRGTWFFDGESCDPTTTDWPVGGLHVIAFSYPDDIPPVNLLAQENDKESADHMGGLRYGEVLLFKEALSASDLRSVALYLKEKWLGTGKDTSEGLHEVSLAAGTSCSITGDITIADNATVTIGGRGASAGIFTVDGTVTFGKNVEVAMPDGRGQIALVSADDFEETSSLSTWRYNGARLRYTISDGTLYVNCGGPGLSIIVR